MPTSAERGSFALRCFCSGLVFWLLLDRDLSHLLQEVVLSPPGGALPLPRWWRERGSLSGSRRVAAMASGAHGRRAGTPGVVRRGRERRARGGCPAPAPRCLGRRVLLGKSSPSRGWPCTCASQQRARRRPRSVQLLCLLFLGREPLAGCSLAHTTRHGVSPQTGSVGRRQSPGDLGQVIATCQSGPW